MVRLIKWLLKAVAILLLLVGIAAVHLIWFRPFSVDLFYERVFLEYALDDPELLTATRLLAPLGLNGHDSELTDASPTRQLELQQKAARDLETLRAYDRDSLTASQQLSYDVLEYYLDMAVQGAPWDFHDYPLNPLNGVQTELPEFLASTQMIANKADARRYIERLEKFPEKMNQVLESLRYREDRGILPPRFVADHVLAGMKRFVTAAPSENVLYTSLKSKLDGIDRSVMDPVTKRRMLNRVERTLKESVFPAYRNLIDYFEVLAPQLSDDAGAWTLPDGDAFYAYRVRLHTTTEMTPEEVHARGIEEVTRIEAQMDTALQSVGFAEGSVGDRMAALCADPASRYPDSPQSRSRVIEDFQAIVDEIDQALDAQFHRRPSAGVEVVRMPAIRQAGAPVAYYRPPSLDGARPGRFFVNLRDITAICKPTMRTLAYHEAIPGHHFQSALQQELSGVPTFRRVLPFTAFSEGWALYAERLASELGFLQDPADDLGRLQAEMFRAARLVVDTGLHAQRWSREQAIDYLREKTGMPERDVTAEVERYLIEPGQALAYKVGMDKLLELREHARERLGDAYDPREYHRVVLEQGDLPLSILEKRVEAWIESSPSSSAAGE